MAKKARKPVEPYHVIDNDGWSTNSLSNLSIVKKEAKQQDKELPQCAPHRVYKLVTLEEEAVILAAQRWYDANGEAECHQAEVALEYAVEASRG